MIVAVFFGSRVWEDATPIRRAMDALQGTNDVDGRQAGVRVPGETASPVDGALVVVHSGSSTGVAKRADEEAKRRGLQPVVIAQDLAVCSSSGPVPCTCPRNGWLRADGHRYLECKAAGRRRNAETVAYLLERQAEGATVVGRAFIAEEDDDDIGDMLERLKAAGISWEVTP